MKSEGLCSVPGCLNPAEYYEEVRNGNGEKMPFCPCHAIRLMELRAQRGKEEEQKALAKTA